MTLAPADPPLIFVVAGEPSGDAIGARLMAALKRETGGAVRFAGIGGARMEGEGLTSLFPMSDLTLFGLAEVLPKIKLVKARIEETVAAVRAARPDAVVTIDSPGFSFRVQKRLGAGWVKRIHYVAPTVWAWRPGRARKIARFLDRLLVLLPFEPPYFDAVGLPCDFVGHPVLEEGANRGDGPGFRARHDIPADAPLLVVLPGSRRSEVRALLPVFADVLAHLQSRFPGLHVAVPTVETVAGDVKRAAASWPVPAVVVESVAEKYDAFAAGTVAMAASGTVSLELAIAQLPTVIAYRIHSVSAAVARRLVKVRYATLANIILDRAAVPEFIQGRCRADLIAESVGMLLADPAARASQVREVSLALDQLGGDDPPPSRRAARAVLGAIGHTVEGGMR
jgi:lipid-A-disaccharide synthase